MPFFAELVDEPPEQPTAQVHYDHPDDRPMHWVPGEAGIGVVVGRAEHTVVHVAFQEAYPRGAALEILALLHPDGPELDHMRLHHEHRNGGMRMGLLLPDGRRAESYSGWHPAHVREPHPEPDFHLVQRGSGGGGLSFEWSAWLWPLPPAGPATLYFRWDDRGIGETATPVDLTPVVEAAASAYELWPLPPVPEHPGDGEFGWFAYSPLSGQPRFTAAAPDSASGDAADAGDEDG
ncbi:MAG TPA: hypothetical protein VFL59_06325 [Candidatus Nanopelagicales bacterium]|nr:hypothetical protein [Candidatus Nanopelagicales bacterium]